MRTGKDRVQVEATNVPVTIGNARVRPGDLLRGDAVAAEIAAAENRIRDAVRTGLRLDEARRQFRYHQLQSREKP